MPVEIERKFLVQGDGWRGSVVRLERLVQGYLASTSRGHVRIRRGQILATITVKSPRDGLARQEYEYPISIADAQQMLDTLCAKPLVEKVRHWVEHGGLIWEVDVYAAEAAGLIVAEIELARADQPFQRPPWIGEEVTADWRYSNASLAVGAWKGDHQLDA